MIKSISNYFLAKGRMCRQAFIIQYLAWLFFFALTMGASSLTTEKTLFLSFTHIFLTHSFLFLLALILYPLIVKRLHDRGKSSLFFLLIYVPIVNIALVLYLLFSKGQIGPNKYGENPCEPTAKDRELIEDKSEGTSSIITLLIHIVLITAVFLYSTIQTIDKIPLANEKPINFTTENIPPNTYSSKTLNFQITFPSQYTCEKTYPDEPSNEYTVVATDPTGKHSIGFFCLSSKWLEILDIDFSKGKRFEYLVESIKEKTKEYNAEYSLVIIKNKKALLLKTKSIDGDNTHMYIFYDKNRILIFSNTHPVGEEKNFEKPSQETIERLIF